MKFDLLTTREAANLIGHGKSTLEKWRSQKKGNLPYIRIQGKIKYTISDIEKWIEKNRVIPTES